MHMPRRAVVIAGMALAVAGCGGTASHHETAPRHPAANHTHTPAAKAPSTPNIITAVCNKFSADTVAASSSAAGQNHLSLQLASLAGTADGDGNRSLGSDIFMTGIMAAASVSPKNSYIKQQAYAQVEQMYVTRATTICDAA